MEKGQRQLPEIQFGAHCGSRQHGSNREIGLKLLHCSLEHKRGRSSGPPRKDTSLPHSPPSQTTKRVAQDLAPQLHPFLQCLANKLRSCGQPDGIQGHCWCGFGVWQWEWRKQICLPSLIHPSRAHERKLLPTDSTVGAQFSLAVWHSRASTNLLLFPTHLDRIQQEQWRDLQTHSGNNNILKKEVALGTCKIDS